VEFRYYETNPEGRRIRQSVILGEQALYRTEDDARKVTQALLMRLNDEAPREEGSHTESDALGLEVCGTMGIIEIGKTPSLLYASRMQASG
jgi:hypothetical protein